MNKIRFLVLMCIIGITKITNAQQQVSEIEARNAAINTLYNKTDVLKVSSDERIKTVNSLNNANGDTIMYEVVFQNGAAVLLSGTKTCLPILGFYVKEDNGVVFDPNNDNVPDGLKALLKGYEDDIEWGFAQDTICLYHKEKWQELQQFNRGGAPPFVHVAPLLTTKWGQQWANDGTCPAYNYYVTKTSYNQCHKENCEDMCPIGCTGVAMGQIMKYWNYPVYFPNNSYQYDWCNMSPELRVSSTNYEKERNAIARLLKDCADAANAVYCIAKCNTSATAIAARSALVNDFNYSSNAVFRLRSSHPINLNNVWIDYLRTNLNAGRPVLYGAIGTDAHYWVCDGYGDDGNGNSHEHVYFHFNFGNTGGSDGWYTVDNITANPHWNNLQEAVFNIYPSTNESYCDYTFLLNDHFASGGTHQNVPKTFMKLESASETSPAVWRTIQSGTSATYVAHKSILLSPGFTAQTGSTFTARIEPCESCNETSKSMLFTNTDEDSNESTYFGNNEMFSTENNIQEFPTITDTDFTIYPNPNDGNFTVKITGKIEPYSLEIFNAMGVLIGKMKGYEELVPFNIAGLPIGIYYVKMTIIGKVIVKKVVIQ